MGKTLTLITTKNKTYNFEILTLAWVNNPSGSYVEISAKNATLQTLVVIRSGLAALELASQFHDKLLAVYGRIDTQITAYTNTAAVSTNVDISLDKSRVYLLV
jgi:hypothetical protein